MSISASSTLPVLGWCALVLGCGHDAAGERAAQLGSSDVELRRSAARALAEQPLTDPRVVAALAEAVSDDDAEVRRLSIDALGATGPTATASLPALLEVLEDDKSSLGIQAALAAQRIEPGNPDSKSMLIDAMRNGDGRTLLAVGGMGAEAEWAVPTLIDLLSHELPQLRALAAQTLGRIGPSARGAQAALRRSARDPHAAVQGAARQALERIDE